MRERRPAPSLRDEDNRARPRPSIKAVAVRLLARRDYARAELAQRLLARGANRDEVERALDELVRLGYLSDSRFAHRLVATKSGRFAKRAIARELRDKGVDPAASAEALSTLDGQDETAEAIVVWRRRFGSLPADDREKGRQIRFLMSRGYTASVALKVLRTMGASSADDADA